MAYINAKQGDKKEKTFKKKKKNFQNENFC